MTRPRHQLSILAGVLLSGYWLVWCASGQTREAGAAEKAGLPAGDSPLAAATASAESTIGRDVSAAAVRRMEYEAETRQLGMIAACCFALLTWCVIIAKMNRGFGTNNLRVFGIALVTTFSTFLGLLNEAALTATVWLLGAVAGYLFGVRGESAKQQG